MVTRITVNGTHFNVDETLPHPFWSGVQEGRWEMDTFRLFDRVLLPDWRFVDIGAWIGPTALYAARKVARIHAYDCDPVALGALRRNIGVNPDLAGRITTHEHAIGDEDGFMRLYSTALGNSETSIYASHQRDNEMRQLGQSVLAGVRDVRAVFRDHGYASCAQTFVKMDVEGAEFRILPRLAEVIAESRCVWCVSFHEWNLNPPGLPPEPYRAAQMINALSVFAKLNWYSTDLRQLDKAALFDELTKRTWPIHSTLVFSARDLG
jgi:FkbM family methyltransferase